ncbi:hypothetical protein FQN60_003643 [Etheostoma spectabile]|uniref:Uncharacterized protein n=1 Tax=Etheostoma spectabile TaxID=54343 RepID=A0A5J5CV04_9PERO|nr:hypothetical protein FQN60_003643 [Etheostoma spectabile]
MASKVFAPPEESQSVPKRSNPPGQTTLLELEVQRQASKNQDVERQAEYLGNLNHQLGNRDPHLLVDQPATYSVLQRIHLPKARTEATQISQRLAMHHSKPRSANLRGRWKLLLQLPCQPRKSLLLSQPLQSPSPSLSHLLPLLHLLLRQRRLVS